MCFVVASIVVFTLPFNLVAMSFSEASSLHPVSQAASTSAGLTDDTYEMLNE